MLLRVLIRSMGLHVIGPLGTVLLLLLLPLLLL